jgi:hypothetical protein
VANEVFLSLAREIEAQGVGRKVAADMFGLALRTYQKKVQRLTESATAVETTLWEAVLDYLAEHGSATRQQILGRFARDPEREVIGVLTDLVGNGLLHASGREVLTVYGLTTDAERRLFAESAEDASLDPMAWALVRGGSAATTSDLAQLLRLDVEQARAVVRRLAKEGRIAQMEASDDAHLQAVPLFIPLGAEMGWEAAVFDHFRAVAAAIAAKLRSGPAHAAQDDIVGGTTLSFRLGPEHPWWAQVHGLLARTRREAIELWERVEAHNVEHPVADERATRVWFYFGQYVEPEDEEEDK